MKVNFKIFKKGFWYILFSVGIFSLIGFAEKTYETKECKRVAVKIDYQFDNFFVSEQEVLDLITNNNTELLIGKRLSEIDLEKIEKRIYAHKFVKEAQVYKSHNGELIAEIVQTRPVARIVQQHGPHAYISSEGNLLPFSPNFSARVMLVDGDFIGQFMKANFLAEEGQAYMDFFNRIDSDRFWKAQVAQVTIADNGEINITPQVGDEIIEFGKPEDIDEKLNKLKVFYKKILPLKGYNKYERVKLKFKNQIICE
ncbi:cell division protein FtsQ [Cytophagaceae bacterium ABcell3]|nr:cell division protein FtsQ [Cytophagaceae bacterium ABcell3]